MVGFGVFLLVVAGLVLLGGVLKKMRAGRIGNTPFAPPSQIAQNGRGIADAKGSIATEGQVRHGQLLTSPISNAQCLFYDMKVDAEWKVGESKKRVTIVQDNAAAPFTIADANGQIGVALDPKASSEYDVATPFNGKRFSRGLLGTMMQKPIEVTPAFSIPAVCHYTELGKQWEVPSHADFFVTERVLEPKPFFHVNGRLQEDGTIGSPKWTSLLVKEKNRDALLADSAGMAKKLFIGGGASAAVGVALAAIGALTATPEVAQAETTTTSSVASAAPAAPLGIAAADKDDDDKPSTAKTGSKTAAVKPAADKAADSKTAADSKAADSKAADSKTAADTKPAADKAADSKPADNKAADGKTAEKAATDTKPADKPAADKPAADKPAAPTSSAKATTPAKPAASGTAAKK